MPKKEFSREMEKRTDTVKREKEVRKEEKEK